jgi:hypothetical protein
MEVSLTGASIDPSRLTHCHGSVNSQAFKAGFAYEIASDFSQIFIGWH